MNRERVAFTNAKNQIKYIPFFFENLVQFKIDYMMKSCAFPYTICGKNMKYKLHTLSY